MTAKKNGKLEGWEIDLGVWSRARDYNDWNKIAGSGDMERISEKLTEVLVVWPYEGDPKSADAILDLRMDNWVETLAAVGEAVNEKFQAITGRRK